ncbi:MAG TPA: hypothetical protein VJB98_03445 [Candidatus Paceibacterota bacterium]
MPTRKGKHGVSSPHNDPGKRSHDEVEQALRNFLKIDLFQREVAGKFVDVFSGLNRTDPSLREHVADAVADALNAKEPKPWFSNDQITALCSLLSKITSCHPALGQYGYECLRASSGLMVERKRLIVVENAADFRQNIPDFVEKANMILACMGSEFVFGVQKITDFTYQLRLGPHEGPAATS